MGEMSWTRFRFGAQLLAWGLLLTACGEETPTDPGSDLPIFVVEVSGEQFKVRVADTMQVRLFEERRASGAEGVINGPLEEGDGGFNAPWSWHLDPELVHVVDLAIEICDGRPSMVEADLSYWFVSVKQFCPWGARVVGRE